MTIKKDAGPSLSIAKAKWILIIDDESEMREILKIQLRKHVPNAKMVESDNGADAFQKISRQKFDLVISDLQMPKMDGKSLIQMLPKIDPHFVPTYLLVLSGHLDKDINSADGSAISYMGKPVSKNVFLDYLKKTILKDSGQTGEKQKIAVDIINPFVAATIEVIRGITNADLSKETIYIRTDSHTSGDISASVALNNKQYIGSIGLCFDESCFLRIASTMLGTSYTTITDSLHAVAGKVLNQIVTSAREKIQKTGQDIQTAEPAVVAGKGHRVKHMAYGTIVAIKFKTEHGFLTLETVQQSIEDLADKSA